MDAYLLDYLRSGAAWVLVGSGPSNALGYPSWKSLAESAVSLSRLEGGGVGAAELAASDYPSVFEAVGNDVGVPRLLQDLRTRLVPDVGTDMYTELARWPVGAYLTTNFDSEILTHLGTVGAGFREYGNSEDHLALLVPGFSGGVFKLHGDLTTSAGLVLMASQYKAVRESSDWEYWRTKMTSIFQMNPTIVVGHSLTDPHVVHILAAAKKGAGVTQPVIWIAPDVTLRDAKDMLERYRVRVVSYSNRDGTHRNLKTLLSDYTSFVQPRGSIRLAAPVREIIQDGSGDNAGAAAFYVFNRLSAQPDAMEKRLAVALATIESGFASLDPAKNYSVADLLESAGWPSGVRLAPEFEAVVAGRAVRAAWRRAMRSPTASVR